MVTHMKENGKIIKQMDMDIINISQENIMMEIGKMINKMEKGKKLGLMVLLMKEIMSQGKEMVMVFLNGLMEVNMKEIFVIICLMERVNILGVIKENI